ncbi:MAG: hypothetical protein ACR2MQ_00185 [Gemmatimonadaceae bacterium]
MLALSLIATVPMLLAPAAAPAHLRDVTAPRSGVASATGATTVRIVARAGYLHIQGRAGLGEVRAQGTARASSSDVLKQVQLVVKRSGSVVEVTVVTPDQDHLAFFNNYSASLDLTVEVPTNLALDVSDGSGDTIIRGTGPLKFSDGSGDTDIDGVAGDLSIDDGSGDIIARNIRGNVHVVDGSGDMTLSNVGSVDIASDGSGDVHVDHVTGDVSIGSKGSGHVEVASVGGNFTVGSKGSGSIHYEDVKGRVDVPERYRR